MAVGGSITGEHGVGIEKLAQMSTQFGPGELETFEEIKAAFDANPDLTNLLLDPFFKDAVEKAQASWRRVVTTAVELGVPVPAISTALAYYDGYRHERLPANLLQAQRDYFGAHTYERVDRPRGEFFHTNWTGRGGDTSSSTYEV